MSESSAANSDMTSKASFNLSPKGKNAKGQRKSSSLPSETVEYLKAWMMSPEHIAHPYPTEQEKAQIMADTGIELKQLTNWFVNNRKRYWKPRVEARLQQQAQAAAAAAQAHAVAVAAVTAAAHVNPVTPDSGFKPTLTLQAPLNEFVNFDLVGTPTKATQIPLVGTDFARILTSRNPAVVSETSSAASSSVSDGEASDAASESGSSQAGNPSSESSNRQCESTEMATNGDAFTESREKASGTSSTQVSATSHMTTSSKRKLRGLDGVQRTRKKFRRCTLEVWREVCQNATHVYDEDLPSMEEASRMFGYAC